MSDVEWKSVSSLVALLQPFNKYTNKLQSETVTLSDIFGFWTSLRLKVAKNGSEFAKNLIEEMNLRHDMLMDNPTILAAIYVDPRFQRTLRDKKSIAIQYLVNICLRMKEVENFDSNAVESSDFTQSVLSTGENDSEEELYEYLNACSSVNQNLTTSDIYQQKNEAEKIKRILNEFDGTEEPPSTSVLEFWEKNKNVYNDLYKLASVIFSIPPTQSSVERAFSALALVLTSRRTKLNSKTLEEILLIRLNYNIF